VDLGLAVAGLFVGVVVGLTGMGGGALMTPVLVLFFGVQPLAAVSSDLVASAVMKPLGGFVHLRRGTVNLELVKWLMVGSVPAAFAGVLVLRWLGDGESVQQVVKVSLGIALFVAAASLIAKSYVQLVERGRRRASGTVRSSEQSGRPDVIARPLATVLVGVLGGLIVGMTSVGSGSLIIVALLALYPSLQASQLVGTDLVQAVPLVASAAVAHMFFGDFQLDVTASLLIGCLPGVYIGAQLSSRAPGGIIRRALSLVLLASALKLVGASTPVTVAVLATVMLIGPPLWAWARVRHGFPPLASRKIRLVR
jgi:uncharacterized membrane protein YfcA